MRCDRCLARVQDAFQTDPVTELLVLHHALGLTEGVRSFAAALEDAGHTARVPDLYDGLTFADLASGVAHAEVLGFEEVVRRGEAAAEPLSDAFVPIGFSLGVMPAQKVAQTRRGILGAVFVHSAVPPAALGGTWPGGLPLQMHISEGDEDVPVCQELAAERGAELWLYPGSAHLFADPGSGEYDDEAARLLLERVLEFLDRVGGPR